MGASRVAPPFNGEPNGGRIKAYRTRKPRRLKFVTFLSLILAIFFLVGNISFIDLPDPNPIYEVVTQAMVGIPQPDRRLKREEKPSNQPLRGKANVPDQSLNREADAPTGNTAKDGSAFCLLIKDDNDILAEWVAYHYHVFNMRRLIVAVDPESKTTPLEVLQPWIDHPSLDLEITFWYYTPEFGQRNFISECYQQIEAESSSNKRYSSWIDTDENLEPNPWVFSYIHQNHCDATTASMIPETSHEGSLWFFLDAHAITASLGTTLSWSFFRSCYS